MSISKSLKPINSVKPVAPYIGGKRNLAKRICKRIEAVDHTLYAEPFVGMGGVFFRRNSGPKNEVINDLSEDVSTLFRILQRHYPQFLDTLKFQITSRREFERLQAVEPSTLTDLERAARFLYLQRAAFGGKVSGRNFAMSKAERGARFDLTKLVPMLEDVHERLSGVVIERLPFDKFIKTYDRKRALFYIDPPYYGNETDYGAEMFSRSDFELLAAILRGLKGRFILSLNDCPEVREIFSAFTIEGVKLSYGISAGPATSAREVIISN
jgi:DNA adenine methylase